MIDQCNRCGSEVALFSIRVQVANGTIRANNKLCIVCLNTEVRGILNGEWNQRGGIGLKSITIKRVPVQIALEQGG